jgi:hypothetical protein
VCRLIVPFGVPNPRLQAKRRVDEVALCDDHPGDYATLNSNQSRDSTSREIYRQFTSRSPNLGSNCCSVNFDFFIGQPPSAGSSPAGFSRSEWSNL